MAFTPKSRTATGLPTRKQQLLPDKLDLGMKSFLHQTSCSEAMLALRTSFTRDEGKVLDAVRIKPCIQNKHKDYSEHFWPFYSTTSGHLGNLRQLTAEAFPIKLPKPSEIGLNDYRKFINKLHSDSKKWEAYFKSLSRDEERRGLKILNHYLASRVRETSRKENDFVRLWQGLMSCIMYLHLPSESSSESTVNDVTARVVGQDNP